MTTSEIRAPWRRMEEKVVMVTGASSGLGREMCLDLAEAGCRIVAAARRVDRLKTLCEEINGVVMGVEASPVVGGGCVGGGGVRAVAVELDVSAKGGEVEVAVRQAWDAFGRIDVLVNNAGIRGTVKSPLDMSEEEWKNVMSTNLTGTWLVSKYVGKLMVDANQKGSIINISSIAGLTRGQLPGSIGYSSSKAAINNMTREILNTFINVNGQVFAYGSTSFNIFDEEKVMALELGPYNIRVNSISPGIFKSEITDKLMVKKWIGNVVRKTVPLKTLGTSDPALTSVVRYLIDDSSEYVSGNVFVVDAGATLPGIPIFSSL